MSTQIDKDIVALQTWWMGELKAMTKKVAEQEERRQTRERERAEKALGEYRTFSDVQDAYGCGVITERKAYQLYDLLEKINTEDDRLYRMKLDLLAECYQIAKKAVEGHSDE